MAVESARPTWPAAASYAARGQVDVLLEVDSLGTVREARVDHRRYHCPDTALATAIDSAAVVAGMRWRFDRAKPGARPAPVTTSIPFRIPDPPAGQTVVVGCVRDSLSKHPRPLADILGANGKVLGRADETGWFVLKGTGAAEAKKIRASAFCYAGGFRAVRPWRRPGDELTLYAWKNTCADNPGR
jgi:TonB family protein